MAIAGWTFIAAMLVAAAAIQWVGARALRSWGVRPSRAVIAVRAFNVAVAFGITLWAFYIWAK